MAWILARLKERTTWLGLVGVLTSVFSFTLEEPQREAIIQVGLAVVSLIAVFLPDQTQPFPKPKGRP